MALTASGASDAAPNRDASTPAVVDPRYLFVPFDAGIRSRSDAGRHEPSTSALQLVHGAIHVGVPAVSAPELADAVRGAVQRDLPSLGACYEQVLADAPRAAGHIVVHVGLRSDGSTISPTIIEDSASAPALERCVLAAAERWRASGTRARTATIDQPLDFAPRHVPL